MSPITQTETSQHSSDGMTRWVVLAAGVVLQMVLGGIYAWSTFVPPLLDDYGLSKGQCGLIFGATIAVFSLAMIPAGRLLHRRGPRLTAGLGAVLFGLGYLVASFSGGSFLLLLGGIGVLTGAGIGFGYVCPLTTGMQWFPRHRGLVTGVAVAGFGGGAIVLSFLAEFLLVQVGMDVLQVFRVVGIGLGFVAFSGAILMREPPKNQSDAVQQGTLEIREHLTSPMFWLICLGLFAGTFGGLLVVSNLKPMMLSFGLNESAATLSISLFAVGNVLGRIVWGKSHDRFGSETIIQFSLASLAVSLFLLLLPGLPTWILLGMTLVVGAGFGGCFVVYASSIVDYFGVHLFPRLYPICFLFYGLAALTGPPLGGGVADRTGSFANGVLVSIAVIGISLLVIWISTKRCSIPVTEEVNG